MTSSNLGAFVWSIAEQLRGVYKPAQYGNVILPLTILRRLDCLLAPTKADVLALAAHTGNPDLLDIKVRQAINLNFYNTSTYDFGKLLEDPDNLRSNLIDYISKFSGSVMDVFDRFKFENEIATMDEKNRLLLVLQRFRDIDLHPDVVSNADMGSLFEDLIRRFAEAANETAGEHFTPRDAIHLMVDLLFAQDDEALTEDGVIRTIYDPTAGTGGMLSVAEEHISAQNETARVGLFGQELNDHSYAICKADMIAKGRNPQNIRLGDTLGDDLFGGKFFDYCLSNPPYGVNWRASEDEVRREYEGLGADGRFGAGLPSISDGQMLFLTHLAKKMRPRADGGGRAGIVLNGSPLYTGAAGSGESNIRKWLLEADLVDAIIALPTNMFYNTDIATYVWLLDNNKPEDRRGKIQLIDGSAFYKKMRKNLGDKGREMSETDRLQVMKLYDAYEENEHSRILEPDDFGYWTITVERPLRLNFSASPERIEAALQHKAVRASVADLASLNRALVSIGPQVYMDRAVFLTDLRAALRTHDLRLSAPTVKALWQSLSERDQTAQMCLDAQGNPEPDPKLRDNENVPFRDNIAAYFDRRIRPYLPDAWIDETKTRIGYEIPFTRYFFRYTPARPLEVIDADLNELIAEIVDLLSEVEA